MNENKEKPEMLTVKEVRDMFRISRTTLYNWIEKGKLTPLRPGKKLLFKRSDIEKLLDNS